MNDRTLQRPELRACEEVDLHHADKLVYKAYAQMVERRIRMQNPRPQTPPGMNLAERIMWKRNQMREEQSYRENLPVDPEDISTDIEQYTEERIQVLPPAQFPPRYSTISIAEKKRPSPYHTPSSPDNSPGVATTGTHGPRENLSDNGQSLVPGQSLLAVPVLNDSLTRSNSAPNRTSKLDVDDSPLERRNSTLNTYDERKREKRRKKNKDNNETKEDKLSPKDAFAENKSKRNDKAPSVEKKETLKKIQDLEHQVDRNLDDLLGGNRQNMAFLVDLDDARLDALLEKL